MIDGKNITWYASSKRREKLINYAIKKGNPDKPKEPAAMNNIMIEIVDFFFKHKGNKNGN